MKSEPLTPTIAVLVLTLNPEFIKLSSFVTVNLTFPRPILINVERVFFSGSYMLLFNTSFVFDDVKETFFSQIPISNNLTITNNLLDQPAHLINSRVVQIQKVASAEIAKTIQSSLKKTKNKELSKDYTKAIELANSKNDMLTKAAVQTLALAFASNKISKQDFTLELQNLLSALKP